MSKYVKKWSFERCLFNIALNSYGISKYVGTQADSSNKVRLVLSKNGHDSQEARVFDKEEYEKLLDRVEDMKNESKLAYFLNTFFYNFDMK